MNILVPQGVGDSVWCLVKAQGLVKKHGDNRIDLKVGVWNANNIESRAIEFLRKFKFVNSVEPYVMPHVNRHGPVLLEGPLATEDGLYRYIPDGKNPSLKNIDFVMMPNAPLERGINLSDWLPDVESNFEIFNEFNWLDAEKEYTNKFKDTMGEYVIFFIAGEGGNCSHSGHNRGLIFTAQEWVDLGDRLHEAYGVKIIVVGADWDLEYYNNNIRPKTKMKLWWKNFISQWPIEHTLAVIKNARFMISYQSGLGVCANYMGTKTAMWWRQKRTPKNHDDSISYEHYIAFHEDMAFAWTKPGSVTGKTYFPCYYGRHGVNEILNFIKDNGW
jgi:hypothetical protein